LYCFGYGLSYTTFKYEDLKIDSVTTASGNVNVSCRITNTGNMAGDEVVQMYLNDVISSTTTYEKNLRGFERVPLKPGESATVVFPIVRDDLILINVKGDKVVEPGEFRVMIGSSYEDIRLTGSFFVVDKKLKPIQKFQKNTRQSQMMRDTDQ
jgi:beta-glucosidase